MPPSPWLNVVPRLKNLGRAVLARNEQANLQRTLNKTQGVRLSQFLSLIVSKIKKNLEA